MMIKKKLHFYSTAGSLVLAVLFWPGHSNTPVVERTLSSTDITTKTNTDKKLENTTEKSNDQIIINDKAAPKKLVKTGVPVPYFAKSENFKTYTKLLYKVVKTPEERSLFNFSLLDNRSLEDAASFLKQPSSKPGKEEKINHLKASGFLIKAISIHPLEFEVTSAVKQVLNVNLTQVKSQMSSESYTMLKENKAELMYHALAVSEEIHQSYVAGYDDLESQKLLQKVQDLHTSNVAQSKKMIAER